MKPAAQILAMLRNCPHGVGGAELCEQVGVSRAAIWSHIETLRNMDFDIIASPHRGYKLLACPDELLAEDLHSRLAKDSIIGRSIRVMDTTTSTNDEVERSALKGESEGLVIFAETQSKGRGRMGRKWSSPAKKGLWFSILLRPPLRAIECTQITIASAIGLRKVLSRFKGINPQIKWPNDILVRGRKIAGILTEMSAEPNHVKHLVVGIGIDVNQTYSEMPAHIRPLATSLKILLGKPIDRPQLAVDILHELNIVYKKILSGDFEDLAGDWSNYCTTLGKRVSIEIGSRKIIGCAEALDETGALLIRTEHGRIERVVGGDVNLEK